MEEHKCPHCFGMVPAGAKVCRGCQAEISYGTPDSISLLVATISIVLGFLASRLVEGGSSILGYGIGLPVLAGLSILCTKHFRDRVVFKRVYKS